MVLGRSISFPWKRRTPNPWPSKLVPSSHSHVFVFLLVPVIHKYFQSVACISRCVFAELYPNLCINICLLYPCLHIFCHFKHLFNILESDNRCSSFLNKPFTKQALNTADQNTYSKRSGRCWMISCLYLCNFDATTLMLGNNILLW